MSSRGVRIRSDSLESLEEFQPNLSAPPKSPITPRSPHIFLSRVDYFTRGEFTFSDKKRNESKDGSKAKIQHKQRIRHSHKGILFRNNRKIFQHDKAYQEPTTFGTKYNITIFM